MTDMELPLTQRMISEAAGECLDLFHHCLSKPQLLRHGPINAQLEDQYGRFNIWATNIGVFAAQHASMDYRLREAAEIKDLVVRLLETLLGHINQLCTMYDGILTSREKSDSQTPALGAFESNPDASEQSLAAVAEDISILHKLSNTIRKASVESHNLKAATSFPMRDTDGNDLGQLFKDSFAASLLKLKFPGADERIRDRLASAMLLRRRRILYRKSRLTTRPTKISQKSTSAKVPKQPPKIIEVGAISESKIEDFQSRLFPTPSHVISQAHTATTLDPEKFRKASAPSRISAAKSIPLTQDEELDFPPMPIPVEGIEPVCPYCFLVLLGDEVEDSRKWREHVKNDLDPYVCLFDECDQPDILYKHSQPWLKHMRQQHMLQWRCPAKSHKPQIFHEQASLEDHMRQNHSGTFSEKQLPILIERSVRTNGPTFPSCPLCGLSGKNSGDMEVHVVQHLRFLALKSLPWPDDVDDTPSSKVSGKPKTRTTIAEFADYTSELMFDEVPYDAPERPAQPCPPDEEESNLILLESQFAMRTEQWGFLGGAPFGAYGSDSRSDVDSDSVLKAFAERSVLSENVVQVETVSHDDSDQSQEEVGIPPIVREMHRSNTADEGLIACAERCERHLDSLKKHASDCKAQHRTEEKKAIIEDVISHVNENANSLEAWRATISAGRLTFNQDFNVSIRRAFDKLSDLVATAWRGLDRLLAMIWIGPLQKRKRQEEELSKALHEALDQMKSIIEYLQHQPKAVLRESSEQARRQDEMIAFADERHKSYFVFVEAIKIMSKAQEKNTMLGQLNVLWREFPNGLDLEGNVGNPDNPGDGKIYSKECVAQVAAILKAFYDAWSNNITQEGIVTSHSLRKAQNLTGMARICLILRGMSQETLLDDFCESNFADDNLPFRKDTLVSMLDLAQVHDFAYHAATFHAEQYRAICRTWNDGDHIEIPETEPLPLLPLVFESYNAGSFGFVMKVRHAFTDVFYARKEQRSHEGRGHLVREIARLKKLSHRHVIKFVKSYERGSKYGMLLIPAATTDLQKLLVRYKRNGLSYDREGLDRRRDRAVFNPVLLTAFGCLSHGLAHIHDCHIRHKDIKPANILYEKGKSPKPAKFLWADFGLAHDFETQASSKTMYPPRYSTPYAAPETMQFVEAYGEPLPDGNADDKDKVRLSYRPYRPQKASATSIAHGLSSDIYSFGIVFLEILAYLTLEGVEPSTPQDFEDCAPFWKNTRRLQQWAETKTKALDPKDLLIVPFQLAIRMISLDPADRPTITEIVRELMVAGPEYFCHECYSESLLKMGYDCNPPLRISSQSTTPLTLPSEKARRFAKETGDDLQSRREIIEARARKTSRVPVGSNLPARLIGEEARKI